MSATSFLLELAQRDDDNQVPEEGNYLTDTNYEQERFTDTYSKDFEDHENKA